MTLPASPVTSTLDDFRGTAGGLAGGLVASWAMDQFQNAVIPLFRPGGPDHGDQTPAPVKAANFVARLASGKDVPKGQQDAAGSAVHYIFGGLSGAVYGLVAERNGRAATLRGAAFGIVCATLIDQLAVPLSGLARPPWHYTLRTHVYAYLSHAVFGLVTEAVRRSLRGPAGRKDYTPLPLEEAALPFALGLANGQRTMTPPAAVSIAAAGGALDLKGTRLAFLAHPVTAGLFTVAALGEYYADVQPGIPARTSAMGLGGRVAGAALAGAAIAQPDKRAQSALIGAGGAVAGAFIGYRVRMAAAKAMRRDLPVGLAEDLLCLGGTAAITAFVVLKRRREARRQQQGERVSASARHQAQQRARLQAVD